jgi:hypothetical protein
MTTQAQDTHTQDPIERFTLRMEEIRQDSVLRGPMRLLHDMILALFTGMFRVFAKLAEMRRNGTLPEWTPPAAAEQPRAWPAELRPRESGWLDRRDLWDPWSDSTRDASGDSTQDASGDSTAQEPIEQPTPVRPASRGGLDHRVTPGEDDKKCVVVAQIDETPTVDAWGIEHPLRRQPVKIGYWPLWRGPGVLWTTDSGFFRLDSQKWVFRGLDNRVHFVSI